MQKTRQRNPAVWVPEKASTELSPWRDLDQMFEDFLGRRLRPFWPERWWPAARMDFSTPPVDVYRETDDIVVKAELPGMEKDDIELSLSEDRLTIKARKNRKRRLKKKATIGRNASIVLSLVGWSCRPKCKQTKSKPASKTVP
jgi:HSP20 family molecular chaperone IbpA